MLRAVALRFESGAITASSTPGTSSSARRMEFRPVAVMPSSLVRRTLINERPGYSVADRLQVERVRRRSRPRLAPRTALEKARERLGSRAQHRPDEYPDHVAHEVVGLDPE